MTEHNPAVTPERQWSRQVVKEYREHRNPQPESDIDVVWVISGWSVYNPSLSPEFKSVVENTIFANEDTQMINFGIGLVYEITAKRLGENESEVTKEDVKEHGPVLIYNGNIDQNDNLRLASQKSDFPLPLEKLRVEKLADDRDPRNNNTNKQ